MSKEVQKASDLKDAKKLYGLLNQVFGPTPSLVTHLKSKDNTTLIKDPGFDLSFGSDAVKMYPFTTLYWVNEDENM